MMKYIWNQSKKIWDSFFRYRSAILIYCRRMFKIHFLHLMYPSKSKWEILIFCAANQDMS